MDGFQIIERYLHFASTQKGCPRITKQIYSEKMHITTATSSISAFMISDQEMESLSKKWGGRREEIRTAECLNMQFSETWLTPNGYTECKKWFMYVFVQQQKLYSMACTFCELLVLIAALDAAVTLLKKKYFLTAMVYTCIWMNKQCLNITTIYRESLQVTHLQGLSH